MTLPNAVFEFRGEVEGVPSTTWTKAAPLGGRITRRIGLYGDRLQMAVAAEDWGDGANAVGYDADGVFDVRFGDDAEFGDVVTLGGYVVQRVDVGVLGTDIDAADSAANYGARVFIVTLVTRVGKWRDGRGGLIRQKVYNPLKPDGSVDVDSDDYKTMSELAQIAVDALGIEGTPPAGIDTLPDGTTEIVPPGPIDWGNARAIPDLEDLLRYAGWVATLSLDGAEILFTRLKRAGEPFTVPTGLAAAALPGRLADGPGVRGSTVVVTSGTTRATVMASRTIGQLEWVAFDERSGAWLNGTEWAALYPDDEADGWVDTDFFVPGSIAAFRKGPTTPDAGDSPADKARAFNRIFGALRLTGTDLAERSRFVNLTGLYERDEAEPLFGNTGAVYVGRGLVRANGGVLVNDGDGVGEPLRVDGVVPIVGEGVFRLPGEIVFAKITSAASGTYAEADALVTSDGSIIFAHESTTGTHADDYFVTAYELTIVSDVLTATKLTGSALAAAVADPDTIKFDAPYLRLLIDDDGSTRTDINRDELEAVAAELALLRGAAATVTQGVVEFEGLLEIQPDGAVGFTSITWDLGARRTIAEVNRHEAPESAFVQLERAARHSVAAGLDRFSLPGSTAARRTPQVGSSNAGAANGLGGASLGRPTAESGAGLRGGEKAVGGVSVEPQARRGASLGPAEFGTILAKITAATQVTAGVPRWAYDWAEVAPIADGQIRTVTDGRTSTDHGKAFAWHEAMATSTGVQGDGVDTSTLPSGFSHSRVPDGRVVVLVGPFRVSGGTEWRFEGMTVPDGECSGGGA